MYVCVSNIFFLNCIINYYVLIVLIAMQLNFLVYIFGSKVFNITILAIYIFIDLVVILN